MKNLILLTMAFFIAMLVQINAQSINLGPEIGFEKAAGADEGKFMGGAALRLKLPISLGFEASINYRSENYLNGAVTVKSWPIMLTALYYPIPIIYGGIGLGWYNTTFEYDQNRIPAQYAENNTNVQRSQKDDSAG